MMISVESAQVGKYHDDEYIMQNDIITVVTLYRDYSSVNRLNITLNSTVNFTCEAVTDEISFRVNDMSAPNKKIIGR